MLEKGGGRAGLRCSSFGKRLYVWLLMFNGGDLIVGGGELITSLLQATNKGH